MSSSSSSTMAIPPRPTLRVLPIINSRPVKPRGAIRPYLPCLTPPLEVEEDKDNGRDSVVQALQGHMAFALDISQGSSRWSWSSGGSDASGDSLEALDDHDQEWDTASDASSVLDVPNFNLSRRGHIRRARRQRPSGPRPLPPLPLPPSPVVVGRLSLRPKLPKILTTLPPHHPELLVSFPQVPPTAITPQSRSAKGEKAVIVEEWGEEWIDWDELDVALECRTIHARRRAG